MQNYKPTGVSLPDNLLKDIDNERGDVSRSRFLLRLILKAYGDKQTRAEKSASKFEISLSDGGDD